MRPTIKIGKTVVAAAGNDSADASSYTPAAYPEVITVSAMVDFDGLPGALAPTPPACFPGDLDDHFADFSNFGAPVDIAAPGACVGSTLPGGLYALAEPGPLPGDPDSSKEGVLKVTGF